MKVYHSIHDFAEKEQCTILTLGTFDGVHLGHQKIIRRLNEIRDKEKGTSALLTFFPHPRRILSNGSAVKMLTTMEEKTELLEKLGLDHLIIEPFTGAFSEISPESFVKEILVDRLKIKKLVIGYDHKFGKDRKGDYALLEKLGKKYGFGLEKIPAQDIKNDAISSTKIRKALEEGNIEKANSYLGYPFLITGEVVKGQGIGKKISYPTINIRVKEDYKLIPKTGVYIIKTVFHGETLFGIMNIGYRPTLNGKHQTIEVHLLNFQGDLYGKTFRIHLLKRIRDEQKFSSIAELSTQIKADEDFARNWLSQHTTLRK